MQDVNDDMDLFRRAAEDYPLKTDSADFNEVLKKLSAEQSKIINKTSTKKKNYKSLLLLLLFLLLIPIGWILNHYSFNISEKGSGQMGKKSETKISKPLSPVNSTINNTTLKPPLVTTNKPSSKNSIKLENKFQNNSGYRPENRLKSMPASANSNKQQIIQNETSLIVTPTTDKSDGKKEDKLLSSDNNKKDKTNNIDVSAEKPLPVILTDDKKGVQKSGDSIINQVAINKLKKKTQKQKEHGLYAGIIIAPDISTVKFQSVKSIGIDFGFLVGYQFGKKISVESGILWDKKFYYSDGKYFNTKEVYIPEHTRIIDVNGLCKMIELPVTVKYNFKQSGKTNFSTSAGFSSYFMKREVYDYTMEKYGQQYPHHSVYTEASTKLFAVMNVSVGYNRTLERVGTLRIEPYVKIPLKGVGMGRLPIMSTGFNIGITKKLSKKLF